MKKLLAGFIRTGVALAMLGCSSSVPPVPPPAPATASPRVPDESARRSEQEQRRRFAATVQLVALTEQRAARGAELAPREKQTLIHSDDSIRERRAGFIAACRACADAASCEREAREIHLHPEAAQFWDACP